MNEKGEDQKNGKTMACLRALVGVTLGDRISNEKLLELSGQPNLENIMRRNRLRWFGHVNRMEDVEKKPKLLKKVMFSYFPDARRPQNAGVRKRWEDKIADDIAKFGIKNWRRETMDKDKWRQIINKYVQIKPVHSNIQKLVHEYKELANRRRAEELARSSQDNTTSTVTSQTPPMSTGVVTNICPNCGQVCKNQRGVKIHRRTCDKKVVKQTPMSQGLV
ncbi:unnamed protein product [Didymodactylos carnosus]|uniref:Uncharacterized protein n=1 Tax=Didymodactylos carnosus TaxID=1234261 RepID=A0A815RD54_9BILA|nr:unnamed protein product [Didymodactylos carnosus]CAF4341823.1 unnamed protein product [Didymodactylos carnosus]